MAAAGMSANLEGRTLAGRYRVERMLGRGGMGAVYEAVQLDLGRHVALKVLLGASASADMFRRFRHEAEAAARLGHPHIVQVTDFQERAGEPPFLVMELLAGRSLRQLLAAEGRVSWQRAARIGLQLLDALGAAHAANIIHRDVKPENVFVVESRAFPDMIKILDFGIAKLVEPNATTSGPLTAFGVAIGTPAYMAPEQALGQTVDRRADLYAVAVCLFEATAGQRPIEVSPSMRLAAAIGAPPARLEDFVPGVDTQFAATLARALAKEPHARFETAAEMAAAIAKALDGGAPDATATTIDAVPPTVRDAPGDYATTASVGAAKHGMTAPTAAAVAPAQPISPMIVAGTLASPRAPPNAYVPPPRGRVPVAAIAAVGVIAVAALGGGAYAFATGVLTLPSEGPAASASAAPSATPAAPVLLSPTKNAVVALDERSFTCRFEAYPRATAYHCELDQSGSKGLSCTDTSPEVPCAIDTSRIRAGYATLRAYVIVDGKRSQSAGGYNVLTPATH